MPIYEYRCTHCGNTLEVMQKVNDPPPGTCPSCQTSSSMERLVSRTSFQLKGGGWYSDLYGSVKKEGKTDGAVASSEKPAAPAAPAAPASSSPSAAPASGGSSGPKSGGGSTTP